MARRETNSLAFTLIEIIIVIVILGVLATLALPRITGQIEVSYLTEAMQTFGLIKRAYFDCYESGEYIGAETVCAQGSVLGILISPGAKFTYKAQYLGAGFTMFQAERLINGVINYICMTIDIANFNTSYTVRPVDSIYLGVATRTGHYNNGFGNCGTLVTEFYPP